MGSLKQNLRFGQVGKFRVYEFLVLYTTILSSIYFRLIKKAKIMLKHVENMFLVSFDKVSIV